MINFLCTFHLSAIKPHSNSFSITLPAIVVTLLLSLQINYCTCDSNDPANTPSVMSSDVAVAPLTVVPWSQWCHVSYGPDEVLESITLPVTKVVITMENNFDSCRDEEECAQRMREMQAFYTTNLSSPSIPYNFMIGNDGHVYEGRGWLEKPLKSRVNDEFRDSTIDIAVVGRDNEEQTTALEVVQRFVKECIDRKIVHEVYATHSFMGGKKLF